MTFAWPHLLWLLVLPAALAFRELTRRRTAAREAHPRIARAEAGMRSIELAPEDAPAPSRLRPRLFLCAGLALAIAALARPQWGRIDEPIFDQSREIILALDLSRSMLTPDVKPSRLERAKLLVQSLLDRLKGERVGLIVFSGTAFLQSPLSADYEILREFLPSLGPDFLPEGGTNYRQLIDTALDSFGTTGSSDRYLVVLSDGEATDDNWKERIADLKERGIKVIGLGVGTAKGGMIPDGSGGLMKDETGAVVMSKLESGTLRQLADVTSGAYRDASSWVDLASLIDATVERGRKGRFVEHNNVRYAERFQWALAPALLCLIAGFWREFPVRPRARDIRLVARASGGSPPPLGPSSAPSKAGAKAAAAGLALMAAALFSPSARADAGGAIPAIPAISTGSPTGAGADAEPSPAANLSKIVGRLSAKDGCSALDWSEMARETIDWGHHLQSSQQPVPEGPVRDALAGVDDGEKADGKVADWTDLRKNLEALLNPEDQKKQDQQKNQDQKQNQDKNQNQNQKQDQNQSQNKDQKQNQGQNQKQDQQDQQKQNSSQKDQNQQQNKDQQQEQNRQQNKSDQNQSQNANDSKQNGEKGNSQSAFGDMKDHKPQAKPQPPQDSAGTQRVGGAEKKPVDPASLDPSLAVPLQKLQQLRDQDSPAELFGLLRKDDPQPPPNPNGKNW